MFPGPLCESACLRALVPLAAQLCLGCCPLTCCHSAALLCLGLSPLTCCHHWAPSHTRACLGSSLLTCCHHWAAPAAPARLQVRVVAVNRSKISLTQRSEETIAAQQKLQHEGLAAAPSDTSSALGRLMARAGITPDRFAPVGASLGAA